MGTRRCNERAAEIGAEGDFAAGDDGSLVQCGTEEVDAGVRGRAEVKSCVGCIAEKHQERFHSAETAGWGGGSPFATRRPQNGRKKKPGRFGRNDGMRFVVTARLKPCPDEKSVRGNG